MLFYITALNFFCNYFFRTICRYINYKLLYSIVSIFWVNLYAPGVEWEASNNQYLKELAKKHSNITLIDWNSYISQHTDLLEEDGIHPMESGADAYAHLIQEKINEVMQKQKEIEEKANK